MLIIKERIKKMNATVAKATCTGCSLKKSLAVSIPQEPQTKGSQRIALSFPMSKNLLFFTFDRVTNNNNEIKITSKDKKTKSNTQWGVVTNVITR